MPTHDIAPKIANPPALVILDFSRVEPADPARGFRWELAVAAHDYHSGRLIMAGSIATMHNWLIAHGYEYVIGSNGHWARGA